MSIYSPENCFLHIDCSVEHLPILAVAFQTQQRTEYTHSSQIELTKISLPVAILNGATVFLSRIPLLFVCQFLISLHPVSICRCSYVCVSFCIHLARPGTHSHSIGILMHKNCRKRVRKPKKKKTITKLSASSYATFYFCSVC